ncbi:DUF2683 family protein [Mucilaginibacter sp. X4EP1]|jgi:hypothetical protein|uniref:DUF2683 family protein n=1 Tax=Mucilaginibacter sp. X4EP1 TaxID=2723092 RepID=UPI002168C8F5|nr:DUF2683 family protein [Mucilaginibacter sp. X4EP1]MCS3814331.1 hypothetical protein [Mucilaginibacter sp. X4EP1]
MESIVVHPESAEQLEAVKAVLKALKIPFEPQATVLPSHVSKSIQKSLKQFENGQTISLEEFKQKHFIQK